ncbi:signal peptide peptidase SppA [Thermococci archaeon]|nr:MAG: signal peptide peptidase SppA [Thermococci archaeon]
MPTNRIIRVLIQFNSSEATMPTKKPMNNSGFNLTSKEYANPEIKGTGIHFHPFSFPREPTRRPESMPNTTRVINPLNPPSFYYLSTQPMRGDPLPKERSGKAILIIILVLLLVIPGLFLVVEEREEATSDKVAILYIEGTLVASDTISQASSVRIAKQLDDIGEKKNVKAVVIRINSPGGSPVASQEIYQAIERLKKKGKKVVVSMGDIATSGAYYLSSAADKIVAEPSTITGGIGVISIKTDLSGLLEKIGVRFEVVKAGEYKDMWFYNRPMTEEERKYLQEMVNEMYEQFIEDVSKGRNMTKEELYEIADGRVFTGSRAKELGLVDELGGLHEAVELAKEISGAEDAKVYEVKRKKSLAELFFELGMEKLGEGIGKGIAKVLGEEVKYRFS